eukprot:UN00983
MSNSTTTLTNKTRPPGSLSPVRVSSFGNLTSSMSSVYRNVGPTFPLKGMTQETVKCVLEYAEGMGDERWNKLRVGKSSYSRFFIIL